MKDWKTNGAVIVSWDFSNGKDAFQGQEARDIYEKLVPKEE